MPTKKITDLTQLTDLDATDSFVVNDSGAGADKRVEFSDLQSEVLNGAAIGTSTAVTELQVDNLNLNGNTFSSTDTNGNILIQPNGTGATVINESGAASDFRVEGDTDTDLLFVDASTDRVGISTNAPASTLDVAGTLAVSGDANFDSGTLFVDVSEDAVGIGTTSPSTPLTVKVDDSAGIKLLHGNDSSTFTLDSFGTTGSTAGSVLRMYDESGNTVAKIDSRSASDRYTFFNGGGGVGIGTSTPEVELDVNGEIRASSGILFGSDTAAANALDDYEEGTFTPTAFGSTTAGTTTYDGQTGLYTKVGNLVTILINLGYTALTGTGTLRIGGLPFAVSGKDTVGSIMVNGLNWTGGTSITPLAVNGQSYIQLYGIADDSNWTGQSCTNESVDYYLNITYQTTA